MDAESLDIDETTTNASTLRRANRAFGPVVAGMIIDVVDFAMFGPFGIYFGLPIGGAVGFWLGKCLGLKHREAALCAFAAAIYCMMPGTQFLPLGTLVGAYARFMESAPRRSARTPLAGVNPVDDTLPRTKRCFVAIALPDRVRVALARMLPDPAAGGYGISWVPPDNLHLTLWFLGDVRAATLEALRDAVRTATASQPPFSLQLSDVGQFPANGSPRVAWAGVRDRDDGCMTWLKFATPALSAIGFTPDDRPLSPHITLARSRDSVGARRLKDIVRTWSKPELVEWRVEDVVLFESRSGPAGVRYEPIERFALRGVVPNS